MTRGSPVINRERDLAGATPETLARVLLRNQLRPRSGILSSRMHKPPMKAVSIPSDGRHQGDIGPKRATGGSMRACTRDRGRQMQTASESRNEGDGRGAPGHGTGRHPSKEAPPEGNASATRAAALGRRMRRPAPTATSPGKRSIFGIAGDRPCTPWLSPPPTAIKLIFTF